MNWPADRAQRWAKLSATLRANPIDPLFKVAVLAAHPDDEVIGASALLARCRQVKIIFLTDGAPVDRSLWPPDFRGSRQQYGQIRRAEVHDALACFGIVESSILWLGGVDQQAIFEAHALIARLAEVLRIHQIRALVTHPYEGGHPDHDSAALLARAVVSCRLDESIDILEMTSYHAVKGHCRAGKFLNADPEFEIELELSGREREQKQSAFHAYASQRRVLSNFSVVRERLRIAPDYDFSKPPHEGKLWYECLGWPMSGESWRKLAAKTLSTTQEVSCL